MINCTVTVCVFAPQKYAYLYLLLISYLLSKVSKLLSYFTKLLYHLSSPKPLVYHLISIQLSCNTCSSRFIILFLTLLDTFQQSQIALRRYASHHLASGVNFLIHFASLMDSVSLTFTFTSFHSCQFSSLVHSHLFTILLQAKNSTCFTNSSHHILSPPTGLISRALCVTAFTDLLCSSFFCYFSFVTFAF